MSSSRVIKGASQHGRSFAGFSFGELQGEGLPQLPEAAEEFQPLFMLDHGTAGEPAAAEQSAEGAEEECAGDNPGPDAEELQRLLQDAGDRGFAEGRREAEESFSAVCRALSETLAEVSGLRERIVRECEDDLLRLAMMVAKQIIGQEISLDRTILAQFVCEAAAGIGEQNDITICFHPEDYQAVSANRHLYLAGIGDKMQISIKPDEAVSIGGCVIETQTGLVDARVETQLAEIFNRLMQERGHGAGELLELPAETERYLTEQCGVERYGYQQN